MAAHGARRLLPMNANLSRILGVEMLCAAQGIGFRAPLQTSAALRKVVARLRADVPPLGEDRYLAPELEIAAELVRSGQLLGRRGCCCRSWAMLMEASHEFGFHRHCEEGEPTRQSSRMPGLRKMFLDCFVALLLAMHGERALR